MTLLRGECAKRRLSAPSSIFVEGIRGVSGDDLYRTLLSTAINFKYGFPIYCWKTQVAWTRFRALDSYREKTRGMRIEKL